MPKEEVIRNLRHIQAGTLLPDVKATVNLGLAKSILVHAERERMKLDPPPTTVSDFLQLQPRKIAPIGRGSIFLYHRGYSPIDVVSQAVPLKVPGDLRGMFNAPNDAVGVKKNSGVFNKQNK